MLASILVLPRMGVSIVELEVPLHVLLVTFQAKKRSGHAWTVASKDEREARMQCLTACVNEGLAGDLTNQIIQQFCDEHPERYLQRRSRCSRPWVTGYAVATEALQRIARIYRIERELATLTNQEHLARRTAVMQPLWEELHTWLQLERARVHEGSARLPTHLKSRIDELHPHNWRSSL